MDDIKDSDVESPRLFLQTKDGQNKIGYDKGNSFLDGWKIKVET